MSVLGGEDLSEEVTLMPKGGRRELRAEGRRNAVFTWASDISGEPLFREIFMATLV